MSRTRLGLILLGLFALGALGLLRRDGPLPSEPKPTADSASHAPDQKVSVPRLCVRVIDGDTLELEGGDRVRLIGVNAPESVDPRRPVERFGMEAAEFTRRLAEGKAVRLEYDGETRDQFGRTLAYIYLPDGSLLNAEIVRQGYGSAYTRFAYRRQAEFVLLEREAREHGRGLWAK